MKKWKKDNKKKGNVSTEIYGIHNKKDEYIPWVIPKTEEQKKRIIEKCLYY